MIPKKEWVHILVYRDLASNIKNQRGVTPVISTILVLMIMFMAVSVLLTWGLPYIERLKTESAQNNIIGQFDLFDESLRDLVIEGVNSTRINNVVVDLGEINFNQWSRKFAVYYFLEEGYDFVVYDFNRDGFSIKVNKTLPTYVDKVNITWSNMSGIIKQYSISPSPGIKNEGDVGVVTGVTPSLQDSYSLVFYDSVNKIDVAKCYVFDIGQLSWTMYSSSGVYSVETENSGLLYHTPSQDFFKKGLVIYNESDRVYLNVMLYRGKKFVASGSFAFRITSTLSRSSVKEYGFDKCYNLTIYMDGKYVSLWGDYLKLYNFNNTFPDFETTFRFQNESLFFTFLESVFDLTIQVGRGGVS